MGTWNAEFSHSTHSACTDIQFVLPLSDQAEIEGWVFESKELIRVEQRSMFKWDDIKMVHWIVADDLKVGRLKSESDTQSPFKK